MKALTWQGNQDVQVDDVPDPLIQEPTDAIIRVTSTAICGSDLHLYGVLGPYLTPGDILGHEAMGVVDEVGPDVDPPGARRPGGHPVQHLLRALLDVRARPVRAVRDHPGPRAGQGSGAVRLHVAVRLGARAGRPSTCGSRRPSSARSRSRTDGPDEQFLYLSDVLPTA